MLTQSVETYLAVRRAAGFALRCGGSHLKSFAAFSEATKAALRFFRSRHRVGGIGTIGSAARPQARDRHPIRPLSPRRGRTPRGTASGFRR